MYALQQTNLNKKIQLLEEIAINNKYIYPFLLIPLKLIPKHSKVESIY